MNEIKRYIPEQIQKFLENRAHIYIKWLDLFNSKIYVLDKEGLIIACDTILRVAGSRDLDKNNMCEIQMNCFHKILHHDYKLYIDYLVENNIIITDNCYIPKEKSISYKLNEDFIDDLVSISIDNKLFNKRTLKAVISNDKLLISKKHKNNFLNTFKIDYKAAIEYMNYCYDNSIPDKKGRILNVYTKAILNHKLNSINDGQLWINRSSGNGRINSNLSILNGDYKQFISGYNYSLDIVSSQPTLINVLVESIKAIQGKLSNSNLSILSYECKNTDIFTTPKDRTTLKIDKLDIFSSILSYEYKMIGNNLDKPNTIDFINKLKSINLPSEKELNEYKILCESGLFYEKMMDEFYKINHKRITRTEAKTIMFSVLYSSSFSKIDDHKKVFISLFPSIYKFLSTIKQLAKIKRSHKMLPILLQGIESYIWIELVLPKLDKMTIDYHFIHDCVIIKKEEDIDRVNLAILEQFYMIGSSPKISIENIKTNKKYE